jgi:hypothetical protein
VNVGVEHEETAKAPSREEISGGNIEFFVFVLPLRHRAFAVSSELTSRDI